MLMITRNRGESFYISGGIKVCILRVSGNRVLVGILAPDTSRILREELMTDEDFYYMECEKCI